MREQFEKLPEIHKKLKDLHPTIVWFSDQEDEYASSFEGFQDMVIWLNGAWYSYQEMQKNIDAHNKKLSLFIDEIKKTHSEDIDNKMDYWRGFSDCAETTVKVFYRDVGFAGDDLQMKANLDDATHWQQKHDEYWLLSDGVYYLFNESHWQRAKPDSDGMVEL